MGSKSHEVATTHPLMREPEALYRRDVDAIAAFFARRTRDPQAVADLTAETFAQAISS